MPWTVKYLESASKSFKKIDPQQRQRIREYLEDRVVAQDDPRQLGKALKGQMSSLWRYRVGDYRVICELQDDALVVLVIRAAHRKHVYD